VCVSGGRIKSAGRLRVCDVPPSPRPRRVIQSPRPPSTKSTKSETSSVAQLRSKAEKTQVQMTPYGLRRVRNQDRPTYGKEVLVLNVLVISIINMVFYHLKVPILAK